MYAVKSSRRGEGAVHCIHRSGWILSTNLQWKHCIQKQTNTHTVNVPRMSLAKDTQGLCFPIIYNEVNIQHMVGTVNELPGTTVCTGYNASIQGCLECEGMRNT